MKQETRVQNMTKDVQSLGHDKITGQSLRHDTENGYRL